MPRLPAALQYPDYRRFWLGFTLSTLGSQFTTVSMAWQIYQLTDSPLQIGLLGLARAIPQMLLLLFGGLLADAVDRRRLLMVVQLLQFCVSTSLAVLSLMGLVTPAVLYLASGLFAICTALGNPSRQALVPNLVHRRDLASALALNNTSNKISSVVGPSLAGLLLAVSGAEWCYAVDAASWIAMLLALSSIRTRQLAATGKVTISALKEGLSFLQVRPILIGLMAGDFGATFFGGPRALLPIYARDLFLVGPQGLGFLYAAASIGSFFAAGGLSIFGQPKNTGRWVVLGLACYGFAAMLFAYTPQVPGGFWLAIVLLAVMGTGDTFNAILRNTINQLVTPDALRGRVSAVSNLFTSTGPQLGQVESGVTADWWGAEGSAFFGGFATLLFVFGIARVPGLWRFTLAGAEGESGQLSDGVGPIR